MILFEKNRTNYGFGIKRLFLNGEIILLKIKN